jgi:ferredoxin
MKKIKNVKISPGCISCGTCEVVCPKVFHIKNVSTVISGADFVEHSDCIREAAEVCPVGVIDLELSDDVE